jgi:hypothetical protein
VTPSAPADGPRRLPVDESPAGLYRALLRHLVGRAAVSCALALLRLARWAARPDWQAHTARNRAIAAHPAGTARRAPVLDLRTRKD